MLRIISGCRASGHDCPFRHDPSKLVSTTTMPNAQPQPLVESHAVTVQAENVSSSFNAPGTSTALPVGRPQYAPPPVDRSRIVQRPTPRAQSDNPRAFQIQQLKRRFSATEAVENGGTAFTFKMTPSDPDFPFELESLLCVLHVPLSYPKNGKPFLDVKNEELARGYQINVERGFDTLVTDYPGSTLLALINALDKQLESLLTGEKAQTIKIIPNKALARPSNTKSQDVLAAVEAQPSVPSEPITTAELYTLEQQRAAEERRGVETRQLEARLGRLPLFSKSTDGVAYVVPIEPRRHDDLPVPLQTVKTVKLFVPVLYPLEQCRIELQGVTREAAARTERSFERKVIETSGTTLVGHINYLAQHMHVFATESEPVHLQISLDSEDEEQRTQALSLSESIKEPGGSLVLHDENSRSHIKVIPRPPEWTVESGEEAADGSDYSDSYDSGDEFLEEQESHALDAVPEVPSDSRPERGISLSFPNLELYGIELLELVSLSITVKCERCKDTLEIHNLRNGAGTRSESCKKCASAFSVDFRRELVHTHSTRAGYLDLDGCTVVDMLPR